MFYFQASHDIVMTTWVFLQAFSSEEWLNKGQDGGKSVFNVNFVRSQGRKQFIIHSVNGHSSDFVAIYMLNTRISWGKGKLWAKSQCLSIEY